MIHAYSGKTPPFDILAGAEMVRRLIGIAHVADMNTIPEVNERAGCEKRALQFGKMLLVSTGSKFEGAGRIQAVVADAVRAAAV